MSPMKLNCEEDITVYKVLGVDEDGVLRSPIRKFKWQVGETMATNEKPEIKEYHYLGFSSVSVEGNAFHTFKEKEVAREYAIAKSKIFNFNKMVVAECVIPADSKFVYLGVFNNTDDSYASEKLKVVNVEEV